MDANLKAKWIEALRSGEFTQYRWGIGQENNLCCLGVGARMAGATEVGFGTKIYSADCAPLIGISTHQANILAQMNDRGGKTYAEIADYIEANL